MLIDATDLCKTYRDSQGRPVEALRGVSVSVAAGEFVAVTGPSGCGKSTLLNVLGCLDRADAGRYRFAGEDVGAWPERRRAQLRNARIGFVFQSFHLLPFLTAAENVRLPFLYAGGAQPEQGRVAEVLRSLGLQDVEGRYPGELSGGQQQRVAIARALVLGAELLLADEPTGNLDAATAGEVLNVFEGLVARGKTVVLVTHDPAVAARASRQVCMEAGRVASELVGANGGQP
jgi:ABC-type lipoprotein export system ATPase subunit